MYDPRETFLLRAGAASVATELADLASLYSTLAQAHAGAALELAENGDRTEACRLVGCGETYIAVANRLMAMAKELTR